MALRALTFKAWLKKACGALLLAAGLWCCAAAAVPYSHYSDGEPLSSVLTDFARSQGLTAQISGQLSGSVSGRFESVEPEVFLKAMQAAYGVHWYQSGGTIFFYSEDEVTQVIYRPASQSSRQLLSALNASAAAAPELPITVDKSGFLVFKGPQIYVENLLQTARAFDTGQDSQVVMEVFKLKHAKAEDLQIESMDKVVNIPGVASILQAMTGSETPAGGAVSVTTQSARVESLRGQGLSLRGAEAEPAAVPSAAAPQEPGGGTGFAPNIIADSRLNAVVIQDYRYRMPYYAQVISELDVPLRLVELHAAIVDIDVNAARDLGVDWQGVTRSGNWQFGGGVGMPTVGGSFPFENGSGGIFSTVFETGHSAFMAQVELLEEENRARTLGRPSILTMDNVEATLENTTTRYIPVRGYESSDLFKVESGTVLRVTPHIIEDPAGGEPYIQLVIALQSNQESNADGSGDQVLANGEIYVSPVSQTKINTQAMVRQGQSLLLGGYYTQNAADDSSGIPGLRSAPYAGGLFGSEGTSSYVRERLLLITPRVLDVDSLTLPSGLDDPRFNVSPTQSDYQKRLSRPAKEAEAGGCSSNAAAEVSAEVEAYSGLAPAENQPAEGNGTKLSPELN